MNCEECEYYKYCTELNYLNLADECGDTYKFVSEIRADAFEELFFLAKENAYDDGVDYSISLQVLDELIEQLKENNK